MNVRSFFKRDHHDRQTHHFPKKSPQCRAAKPATKGERTRAVLLDAAKRLFVSNGYHGTSMRQIADEAGLALGGIYNHFGNKEDIFVAC